MTLDATAAESLAPEAVPAERRLILRLYDYWAGLLGDRALPALRDMDPGALADFKPQSFLLDFADGAERPRLRFVGADLIADCGRDVSLAHLDQVPPRTLLDRLTDHYMQVIATRAPVGFEAEFTHANGDDILYRGLMTPFSDDGEEINFILGAISGKVRPAAAAQVQLEQPTSAPDEMLLDEAMALAEADFAPPPAAAASEPEPAAGEDVTAEPVHPGPARPLADLLEDCRSLAARVAGDESRHRTALYQALGKCFALHQAAEADSAGYRGLLRQARLKVQTRAPFTPLVKLVFGAKFDKTRIAEYALALAHARRHGLQAAEVAAFIEDQPGGIKGCVMAERRQRRQETNRPPSPGLDEAKSGLRQRPALSRLWGLPGMAPGEEFVLLLGRQGEGGAVDILQQVAVPPAQMDVLLRKLGKKSDD